MNDFNYVESEYKVESFDSERIHVKLFVKRPDFQSIVNVVYENVEPVYKEYTCVLLNDFLNHLKNHHLIDDYSILKGD